MAPRMTTASISVSGMHSEKDRSASTRAVAGRSRRIPGCRPWGLLVLMVIAPFAVAAMGVYQAPEDFLKETFAGQPPAPEALWLTADVREAVTDILGHPPATMRLRYWRQGERTAWIVEEIGKEKPITTGIVIEQGRIERIKVLIFRESRGWEVRHDFFTDQFRSAALNTDQQLDRSIDSISGATLSVNAITRLARMVLYLDARVARNESA
jgi:hypothetical protein